MKIFPHLKGPMRLGLSLHEASKRVRSALGSYGLYHGGNLDGFAEEHGSVPVLLTIPPMNDREGALIHPGVRILQTILRHRGVSCEVLNYNLPIVHPRNPYDHLSALIRKLEVKVVGVSLYSQAIQRTLGMLHRLKSEHPEVRIVLGGPHPTEAYLSLVGLSFVDYVVRGEAEVSFPRLVDSVLSGDESKATEIPGVYAFQPGVGKVTGEPAPFVDLEDLDRESLLRYHLSEDELRQYRRHGGAHGLVGRNYWPIALVRGCPYACTYCAAFQISGKKLRYRHESRVVDDMQFYLETYDQRYFSFVDDAFTEDYDYVVRLCREILSRGLRVYWTTDNGIRYESLGSGKRLETFLSRGGVESTEDLLRIMIQAGWRGTSVGVESGSARVRKELVRKGGALLSNEEILANLGYLKKVAASEKVRFFINAYLMVGFPRLALRNGKVVAGETAEERRRTHEFALELRDRAEVDFVHPSIVFPIPATELWDHLNLEERLRILLADVPEDHPEFSRLEALRESVLIEAQEKWEETRYEESPEALFWRRVYELPDDVQILVHGGYDHFNADTSYKIDLMRPDGQELYRFRQELIEEFYGGFRMEMSLIRHVFRMSRSVADSLSHLSYLARTYMPECKEREERDSTLLSSAGTVPRMIE